MDQESDRMSDVNIQADHLVILVTWKRVGTWVEGFSWSVQDEKELKQKCLS